MHPLEPFIVLLLAHLIGDFVLQTEKMALSKGHVFFWLFLHALELGIITWVLCLKWEAWMVVLWVFLSHLIQDWCKFRMKGHALRYYLLDQVCHFIILWLGALYIANSPGFEEQMPLSKWVPLPIQVFVVAFLFVLRPFSIGIALFLKPWQEELLKEGNGGAHCPQTGLTRSGEWIGNLERMMTLCCVMIGQTWPIAGYLVAKAGLRYGEVSQPNSRKRADYVVIGTLISVTIAIILGFLVTRALEIISRW